MNLRVKKQKKYTTVDNGFINDPRLSASSIGVLLYLMSKPDDWKAHKREIVKRFTKASIKTTKNLIDNVFKELRSAGYVRMIPIPASNGKFKGTEYEIREISDIPYLPTSEDIPTSEDNRQSENMPTIQSTDSKLSTKEEIKVITKIEKDYLFLEWKKLFGALRSRKGVPEKRFNDLSLKQINQLFIKTKEYLAFLDVVKWRDKKTAEAFLNKEFWDQDWKEQKNEHLKREGKPQSTQGALYVYKISGHTHKHSDKQRWLRDKKNFLNHGYEEIKITA